MLRSGPGKQCENFVLEFGVHQCRCGMTPPVFGGEIGVVLGQVGQGGKEGTVPGPN